MASGLFLWDFSPGLECGRTPLQRVDTFLTIYVRHLISCCLFCPFFLLISFYLPFAMHAIFYMPLDQFKFIFQPVVPQTTRGVQIWTPDQCGYTFLSRNLLVHCLLAHWKYQPKQKASLSPASVHKKLSSVVVFCFVLSTLFLIVEPFWVSALVRSFLSNVVPLSWVQGPVSRESAPVFWKLLCRGVRDFSSISQSVF